MQCPECRMLRDQIAIAQEEVGKLRDRIAAELREGSPGPLSLKSLQAAERSLDRCIAALERHTATHLRGADGRLSPSALAPHFVELSR
jgi:hypothetical protein